MECDEPDCDVHEGPASKEEQLVLAYFHAQGWFIAQLYGDCCPKCVKAGRANGREGMPESVFSYPSLTTAQMFYDKGGLGVPR